MVKKLPKAAPTRSKPENPPPRRVQRSSSTLFTALFSAIGFLVAYSIAVYFQPLLRTTTTTPDNNQHNHPTILSETSLSTTTSISTSTSHPSITNTDNMASAISRRTPLIFKAVGKHTATVIFTHGLGDTGQGWAQAVHHWRNNSELDEIKFVLPHAPTIPITVVSAPLISLFKLSLYDRPLTS